MVEKVVHSMAVHKEREQEGPEQDACVPLKIPKEATVIFNAPSDDRERLGFQHGVPMETLFSEESCSGFDLLEMGKQRRVHLHSENFMDALRRMCVEDTDSETDN